MSHFVKAEDPLAELRPCSCRREPFSRSPGCSSPSISWRPPPAPSSSSPSGHWSVPSDSSCCRGESRGAPQTPMRNCDHSADSQLGLTVRSVVTPAGALARPRPGPPSGRRCGRAVGGWPRSTRPRSPPRCRVRISRTAGPRPSRLRNRSAPHHSGRGFGDSDSPLPLSAATGGSFLA
jgi:hypothetical protein